MDRPAGPPGFGTLLRRWRTQRGLSQMALALDADVSTRHLSGLETGRAAPSRAMVLRHAERLDVPLRERNALLQADADTAALLRRLLGDTPPGPRARAGPARIGPTHVSRTSHARFQASRDARFRAATARRRHANHDQHR